MKTKKSTANNKTGKGSNKKTTVRSGVKIPMKQAAIKSAAKLTGKKSQVKADKKIVKKEVKKVDDKPVEDNTAAIRRLVHLLQVHQVELEHQNQELRISQEELEASRNQYVNLFDFSPVPYFSLNMNGKILAVNLIAGKMLGLDRKVLIGRQFVSFIPMANRDVFNTLLTNIFTSSKKSSCEINILNKEKRVFRVRVDGIEVNDVLQTQRNCLIAVIDLEDYKS